MWSEGNTRPSTSTYKNDENREELFWGVVSATEMWAVIWPRLLPQDQDVILSWRCIKISLDEKSVINSHASSHSISLIWLCWVSDEEFTNISMSLFYSCCIWRLVLSSLILQPLTENRAAAWDHLFICCSMNATSTTILYLAVQCILSLIKTSSADAKLSHYCDPVILATVASTVIPRVWPLAETVNAPLT